MKGTAREFMKVVLLEDLNPNIDFYYQTQFKTYHQPYLIWDKETWGIVLATCSVYRVEVDGKYAGDVILEDRGKDTEYIVDFSILPECQGKGIGRTVLEDVKKMGRRITAVTRKETLNFFLKSDFVLKRTIKNYYRSGVDGYDIHYSNEFTLAESPPSNPAKAGKLFSE
jgi:ribosomal protein S18 acetylase RimI-like enzyme